MGTYPAEGYEAEAYATDGHAGQGYAGESLEPESFEAELFQLEGYAEEGFEPESYGVESFESEGYESGEGFPSGVVLRPVVGPTGRGQEHWDPNDTGLPLLDTGPGVRKQKVSANFTVGELVTSGGRAADKARISPSLVRLLQGMRERAGKPVRINSGYRSWARNEGVYRGRRQKPTLSRHCSGQAADVVIAGLTGTQIARLAIDVGGAGLGIGVGSNYAHVDVRGSWALWTYLKGAADALARRAVTAHRDRSGTTPSPTPAPRPTSPPTPPAPGTRGTTTGGRYEVARLPLLAGHRGTAPDLVLRWNAMSSPAEIDVVVHLHGYAGPAAGMRLPRDKEKVSGLDFSDPTGVEIGGRTLPTLALLPRGSSEPSAKRPDRFAFPALVTPGAVDALVREGLRIFAERTGIAAPRGRLVLTAHSGGGAPLTAILRHTEPDEVHVFDAFYGPAGPVGEWARRRIEREVASPSPVPPALRVVYVPGQYGTQRESEAVDTTVCAALARAGAAHLAPRFRVEPTSVGHGEIPRRFGWRLLADAGADLPGVQRHVCGAGAAGETGAAAEQLDEDYISDVYLSVTKEQPEIGEWRSAGFALEELEEEALEPDGEAWVAAEDYDTEGYTPEGYDTEGYGAGHYTAKSFAPDRHHGEAYDAEGYPSEGFGSEGYEPEDLGEDLASGGSMPEGFEPEAEAEDYDAEGLGTEPYFAEGFEPEVFGEPLAESESFPAGTVLAPVAGPVGEGQEHWDPNGTGLPLLDTGPEVRKLKLSANFTVRELASSGGVASDRARISPALVRLLQGIRDRAGQPVRVNSGYRSWARNQAVYRARGQTPTKSRHCSGQAVDITIAGLTGTQIAQLAIDAGGTELGIGVGSNYAHVDVRGTWALWTYLRGSAATQAAGTVTAHRALRRSTPAPPAPSPAPPPLPPSSTPPSPGPGGAVITQTPDRLKGVVLRPKTVGPCTGSETPGAQALAKQWRRLTGLRTGIYNCRSIRGRTDPSVHGEGRAVDIFAEAGVARQRAMMDRYLAWLIANAVELQVVYIIWNRRQWGWPQRHAGVNGWREYQGVIPHTDHAHVELSWEGARHPSPLFARTVPGLSGTSAPQPVPAPRAPAPTAAPPAPAASKLTPAQFLARYGPHARASETATGVPALVTLGQAALESGWGARAAGFNFFGIKARATDPPATRQLWRTREVLSRPDAKSFPEIISVTLRPDGRYDYVVRDWFRVFPDAAAAFVGHGEFLRKNRRYATAFRFLSDPYAFAAEVAKAGYATDPSYGRVLANVMKMLERAG